jgi:tRNA (guanine37-N1)-methyltransferase
VRIDVVTIFPELFEGPLAVGLVGKAIREGRAELGFVDPRAFTKDKHRSVDDTPYGGGAGMVLRPGPMVEAIEEARSRKKGSSTVLLLSPQGRPVVQADLRRWSEQPHLILVAGRYEGFDERIRAFADEEVSIGDFVLTGGEIAGLALIDGVVRLLPGTVGNEASTAEDSFSAGLLEHPQYTRPSEFRGRRVPEVLESGDHRKIEAWRHEQSLKRTRARRPDLLAARGLSSAERAVLRGGRPPLERALVVRAEPSMVAGLIRLSAAYQLERLVLVGPEASLEAEIERALDRFGAAEGLAEAPARRQSLAARAAWVARAESAQAFERAGRSATVEADPAAALDFARRALPGALVLGASADPAPTGTRVLAPEEARRRAGESGLVLMVGLEAWAEVEGVLPTIRGGSPFVRLPGDLAAAILLDRVFGES